MSYESLSKVKRNVLDYKIYSIKDKLFINCSAICVCMYVLAVKTIVEKPHNMNCTFTIQLHAIT